MSSTPTVTPASIQNYKNTKPIDKSTLAKTDSRRMIDWLLQSPVRNTDRAQKSFGSFSHGIHDETGRSPGQYTEITGYGVSLLAHLYRWQQDNRFLESAREAARFLMDIQHESGAYPHCPNPESACKNGDLFTFDTSMCTMGMVDLFMVDPEPAYLESARRAGDWLLSMQRDDGAFRAKFLPLNGHTQTGNFFGDGSCIHVKNAMALLKLSVAGGEKKYETAARKVCDYVLGLQAPEGFFWTMPTRDFVFSHAHCYACEGFLSAHAYTGDERYLNAAMKGIEWLKRVQQADGSIFQVYEDSRGLTHSVRRLVDAFKAADATAQSARLFALAGASCKKSYARAIAFLTTQMQSDRGGLFYTRGRFRTNKMLYAWPTMFAIQAIEFARQTISPRDLF